MTNEEGKEQLDKMIEEAQVEGKLLFSVRTRPVLAVSDDETGVNINDGYDYTVDGAVPEIADAIAKFAVELPKNGFGEKSDSYFIVLIKQFYDKLIEQLKE